VKHLFADAARDRLKLMDKAGRLDFVVEIIRQSDDQKVSRVPPRRRMVVGRLRPDDPLAAPRARLRKTHRRLSRHHPRRRGRQFHSQKRSFVIFKTDFNAPRFSVERGMSRGLFKTCDCAPGRNE
jgi:hypothetical protein